MEMNEIAALKRRQIKFQFAGKAIRGKHRSYVHEMLCFAMFIEWSSRSLREEAVLDKFGWKKAWTA